MDAEVFPAYLFIATYFPVWVFGIAPSQPLGGYFPLKLNTLGWVEHLREPWGLSSSVLSTDVPLFNAGLIVLESWPRLLSGGRAPEVYPLPISQPEHSRQKAGEMVGSPVCFLSLRGHCLLLSHWFLGSCCLVMVFVLGNVVRGFVVVPVGGGFDGTGQDGLVWIISADSRIRAISPCLAPGPEVLRVDHRDPEWMNSTGDW